MSRRPETGPANLPHPPPFRLATAARVIGPGAILLGFSVGAGDWILGPAITARHGPTVLWVCTVSVVLQGLLNTEMARYTLATGEPVFLAFMRTPPGARFWAWAYALLHLLQTAWPGWALAGATALGAAMLGRMPREEDRWVVIGLAYLALLGAVAAALLGPRLQRAVAWVEWVASAALLGLLLLVCLVFVPWAAWGTVGAGFVAPLAGHRALPPDVNWALLAAFAAYSGAGGLINATLTHWVRDKGFGPGGAPGAAVRLGGQRVALSQEGALFALSEANLGKWRDWWRYLQAGLFHLWTVGCLVSMALPALVTVHYVVPGTEMGGLGIGAFLARPLGERHGFLLWFPVLLASAAILLATQLGIVGGFARTVTDTLWASSPGLRAWRRGRPGTIYGAALGVLGLGGGVAIALLDPLTVILIGANVAAFNFVVLSAHTLWVNRALLPGELRPPLWREAAVACCGLFFATLLAGVLRQAGWLPALF